MKYCQKLIDQGARHPVYNTWFKMLARCTDPQNKDYRHYGGRGINVDSRWLDFSNFVWDMLPSWRAGLTLDRIDNNKGYCPDNCRWATRQQQALNSRWNHLLEYQGMKKPLIVWAKELGINRLTLHARLSRGWSQSKALSTPVRPIKHNP